MNKTKVNKSTCSVLTGLLLLAAPAAVQAQFDYSTNADGVSVTITRYTGSGGAVVIPPTINGMPVTSIGEQSVGAFENCTGLTSVTIPNSVTSIGNYTFIGCAGLTSVTIPNSVISIGEFALEGCTSLTSVTLPNSVTTVGEGAFYTCIGLASVTIGNGVTNIGGFAFDDCTGLTSVTIPNGVTSIETNAFEGCSSLASVTIPSSVTSIGYWAFGDTGLTSVTIPNSVTSIGDGAFADCPSLASVTIGNGLTTIGGAFFNCPRLTSVYFEGNAPSTDSTLFAATPATAYYFYGTTGWNVFAAATGIPAVMLNPPPGTMVGDGILIEISSGTSPLASFGYSVLLVGDSGNSWNLFGIYNVQDDSGTYTYTNAGPYATVIMNDGTETDNIRLTFTSPNQGAFFNDITYPPAYFGLTQSGNFIAATGTALNSIAGLNVLCSVADGHAPFAASGSYTIGFATSGNTYVMKSSAGVKTSSGTYSYSVVNRSTAAIQITDSIAGSFTVYVGFSNQLSGGYAIAQPSTGGFQIGSFSGTTPPVRTGSLQVTIAPAGAITAGAQWNLDGGILLNSGAATDLPVGNHTVSFNSLNGWTAPDNQTISIKAKTVTRVKGTYTFNGAGVYNGLFMQQAEASEETNGVGYLSSGFFKVTITENGGYSGKMQLAGKTYPFSGTFNVSSSNASGPPAFDALADFSTSANPNGVWSYGWSTAPGEPFQCTVTPFDFQGSAAVGWFNDLAEPDSCFFVKDFTSSFISGTIAFNPDTLHMDPQSYVAIARFTVPSNGSYQVSGLFRLEDTGTHPHDLSILVNGNATNFHVFTSGGTYNSEYPFNFSSALTQGETLDFIVACHNGDFQNLGTGLKASIATADLTGSASTLVPRSGLAPLSLHLQLDSSGGGILTGYIVDSSWTASLTAELAAKGSASAEYTALVLPAGTPPGYGYILITNHGGAATLSVTLADGTSFSENVPLSGAGNLPVYGNLYGSTGLLLGWLGLESGSPTGNLTWIKPKSRSTALYTNGFTNLSVVQGSLWTNPLPHTAAIDLPSGQLDISDGSLRSPLSFNVAVSNNNALVKLPGSPTNSLTGSINAKTGLLTATFGNGAGKATTAAKGAVLQNVTTAAGFFLGKTNAGSMALQP